MMSASKTSCVVFGAGALGLGFLGPELSRDCRVTYLDIPAKAELLDHLKAEGSYVFNEAGLSMRPVRVAGVGGLCIGVAAQEPAVHQALDEADIVLTAVGGANLPKLAPLLAVAAGRRSQERPLRVLCAENGVEIARGLRAAVEREASREFGASLLVGDTVMGRMCRIETAPEPPLEPPAPGLDWAVVAEPFFGIPIEAHAVVGLRHVPGALHPEPPEEFSASEDVKMLAHNGLHLTLAGIGCLKGRRFFSELRGETETMELGRRLVAEEAGPALLSKHGEATDRNAYLNYCDAILRRTTCPVFHDSIARGIRGIMRKLDPWERLVYSVRTVAEQGVEPEAFAVGLAAAVTVAQRGGETDMEFREVLTLHCGFDDEDDADLLRLVEDGRSLLQEMVG